MLQEGGNAPDLVRGTSEGVRGQKLIQKKPQTSVTLDTKSPDMSGALTQHFMRIPHVKTQDGQLQSKLPS